MDIKSRKTEHLDFNEVWFADGNEFGVVLQVRCVVIFDESESVDSSLSLQTALNDYVTHLVHSWQQLTATNVDIYITYYDYDD